MPIKEEYHTTINIRRPLGVPIERPREQSDNTFKYSFMSILYIL